MTYLGLVIAYFLGVIPTGYWLGRLMGIDIRNYGSGSTGATNVWRYLGKKAGIFVFTVDLLKGFAAVIIMQNIVQAIANPVQLSDWWVVGAALFALLGHSKSFWIGFKGGKSVATGLGILVALNWQVALSAFAVWLVTMAIWRTVSISSILGAIAAPIFMFIWQSPIPYLLLTTVGGLFVVVRHRSNIERILQGKEFSFAKNANPESPNLDSLNLDSQSESESELAPKSGFK
jgi:acyl phosphate:glycerol-3-phosphate acyltransferase